jgi:hypothetical protein
MFEKNKNKLKMVSKLKNVFPATDFSKNPLSGLTQFENIECLKRN